MLVRKVVSDGVVLPDHVLDGGLPDGPGALAVGVEAAAPDLRGTAPPTPQPAPLVGVQTGVAEEDARPVMQHEHAAAPGIFRLLYSFRLG